MRRPGTNENDVQMSDVLCDFCHAQWTEESPFLEGHQGSCICGDCLTRAYTEVVVGGGNSAPEVFTCPMCLENAEARRELDRSGEPGWQSPSPVEVTICRRCIKLAAGALHKDPDHDWAKPQGPDSS